MLDQEGQRFIFGKELDGYEKALLKNHPQIEAHWDRVYRIRMIMQNEGIPQAVAEVMDDHKVTREVAEKWVTLRA